MQLVRDIMTPGVEAIDAGATLQEAAACMRDEGIGDVLVFEEDTIVGIATDRDITVRAVAEGLGPDTPIRDVASTDVLTVEVDAPVQRAKDIMRRADIRRLPVVENGVAVGFLTLGDLAIEQEPESVLGDISAAIDNV